MTDVIPQLRKRLAVFLLVSWEGGLQQMERLWATRHPEATVVEAAAGSALTSGPSMF